MQRRVSGVLHDALLAAVEAAGLGAQRAQLLRGAAGRVLEVGAGTGLGLGHYRRGAVTEVLAVEPDPALWARLGARAKRAPVAVRVLAGEVPGLPEGLGSFDTIVCTLVLCTVEDVPAALAELRGLLAPGGQLLFLEHILGRGPISALQRWAAPTWARVAAGCRLDRDTIGALRAAGFVTSDLEKPEPFGRLSGGALVRGRAVARQSLPAEPRTSVGRG